LTGKVLLILTGALALGACVAPHADPYYAPGYYTYQPGYYYAQPRSTYVFSYHEDSRRHRHGHHHHHHHWRRHHH
jgi:hypothetical protein